MAFAIYSIDVCTAAKKLQSFNYMALSLLSSQSLSKHLRSIQQFEYYCMDLCKILTQGAILQNEGLDDFWGCDLNHIGIRSKHFPDVWTSISVEMNGFL